MKHRDLEEEDCFPSVISRRIRVVVHVVLTLLRNFHTIELVSVEILCLLVSAVCMCVCIHAQTFENAP